MKVIEVEKVIIILRLLQFGWSEQRRQEFEKDLSEIMDMYAFEVNECSGCKYEKSINIKEHLENCTHCKRAYHNKEDREIHKDLYELDN